ncbi:MAG: apolipoprotein N-acyltransferase [Hyphomicrobiaceae bacterium]
MPALGRLAGTVSGLTGWRRPAAALSAGAVSVLAMAPFFLWPVLWLTFPTLVLLLDGAIAEADRRARARPLLARILAAATVGWWFGFGYMLPGLYWIGEAFLVEADKFAWLLPFAVTLMPAGLAIFFALAAGLHALSGVIGPARILSLALALSLGEGLRGHVLTGFPWNALGYGLTGSDALMQMASLVGVEGLTFWAVLVFASPALLGDAHAGRNGGTARSHHLLMPAAMAVLLALAAVWGAWRLAAPAPGEVAGVRLRLVQPAIPQAEKWEGANRERIFSTFLDLSTRAPDGRPDALAGITHVVWPESSIPFLLLQAPDALARIADILPPGRVLIAGALRAEPMSEAEAAANPVQPFRVYNSLAAIDDEGRPLAAYDKLHLVPFGEYLPAQASLEAVGLEQLTHLRGGFTAGRGPRRLDVPGLPVLVPLICYEAIFPEAAAAPVSTRERPGFILNVTNDAWFGMSAGPYQHLQQARLRAVEQGLPLVRVANTGITALFDAHGRTLAHLPLGARGTLDVALPLPAPATPFARYGSAIPLSQVITGFLILVLVRSRRSG